jgi:hypothetical protein
MPGRNLSEAAQGLIAGQRHSRTRTLPAINAGALLLWEEAWKQFASYSCSWFPFLHSGDRAGPLLLFWVGQLDFFFLEPPPRNPSRTS